MAPVIYVPDISMPRADAVCPYSRRRQRSHASGIGGRHRAAELKQISMERTRPGSFYNTPPASPISPPDSPISACSPNSPEPSRCVIIPVNRHEQWIIAKRRQGLMTIVRRTIALVRRNRILEKKVEALRLETRNFLDSVMNNPVNKDNERRQESGSCGIELRVNEVTSSSTTEKIVRTWPTLALGDPVDESRRKICTVQATVTSTCNSTSTKSEARSSDMLVR